VSFASVSGRRIKTLTLRPSNTDLDRLFPNPEMIIPHRQVKRNLIITNVSPLPERVEGAIRVGGTVWPGGATVEGECSTT
jgi:hypothetical protein